MDSKNLKMNQDIYEKMEASAKRRKLLDGGLSLVLFNQAFHKYSDGHDFNEMWNTMKSVYKKSPTDIKTLEEFFHPKFQKAISALVGDEGYKDIEEMTKIQLYCQFSKTMIRRCYRSEIVAYHVSTLLDEIPRWIKWTAYNKSVIEGMEYSSDWQVGSAYKMYLALELKRGNKDATELVKEAMLGDNQNVLLSENIIRAIIISGNNELMDILLSLLDAARLQEGLRQSILESADAGSIETFIKILKFCIDKDMFRYSSAVRAFDTWTGLGYTDKKPATVNKCTRLAYECLSDESKRDKYIDSPDNLEAFFAIWSTAAYDIAKSYNIVDKLVNCDVKYRKILGWYFITNTDSDMYRMNMASKFLDERDEEVLAWIISNLATTSSLVYAYYFTSGSNEEIKGIENDYLPNTLIERVELFNKLKEIVNYIGNKNTTFTGNPFEFSGVEYSCIRVIDCMLSIAGYDMNQDLISEFAEGSKMMKYLAADQRRAYYIKFMYPAKNEKHKKYIIEALQDRSVQIKEIAVNKLSECELNLDDMMILSEGLRSKSSSLRKSILTIFENRPHDIMSPVISKMLQSGEDYQIQAGIELLLNAKDSNPEYIDEQKEYLDVLNGKKLSTQTDILFKQLYVNDDKNDEVYTVENGFGLYDYSVIESVFDDTTKLVKEGDIFTVKELKKILLISKEDYIELFNKMNAVFESHTDYEYEIMNYDGSKTKILFGDVSRNTIMIPAEYGGAYRNDITLEMIPFYQEFLEALGEYATNYEKMLSLCFVTVNWINDSTFGNEEVYVSWMKETEKNGFLRKYHKEASNLFGNRYWQMQSIVNLIPKQADSEKMYNLASKIYRSIIAMVGEENLGKRCIEKKEEGYVYYSSSNKCLINHRLVGFFRQVIKHTLDTSERFKEWFLEEYRYEKLANEQADKEDDNDEYSNMSVTVQLNMKDYFRAYDEKIIPKDVLYNYIIMGNESSYVIRCLTNPKRYAEGRNILEKYPYAVEIIKNVVERIVEIEQKRGEMPTPLTGSANAIERFEGAKYFVQLLGALGKENFFRGYSWYSDTTKRAVLSKLLKRCYPLKEDTVEILKEYLKNTDISEKRLVEAVMYAPQWAEYAEKITGWDGLKSGIWFFHAHINETFSAEKETEVAIYSPISPEQFNDGAFDKEWFFEAYERLGEKRFQVLYKSAKYITSGSNQHRRSQLYSDAVLGKLVADTLIEEIKDKRNQEKLRCFPLIPFNKSSENMTAEALARYEFIQNFRKESKQFGAQRRESEKKACDTALQNLAITMGLMDVNRMTWYLESEKIEEIRPLMEPKELEEGVLVSLEFDEEGNAALAVCKNGKRQKTLPKTLNKNEYVLQIKEKIKELKEQKKRAKESLEKAMVESTKFSIDELIKIMGNPVISPMIKNIVWVEETEEIKNTRDSDNIKESKVSENNFKKVGFFSLIEKGIRLTDISDDNSEKDYSEKEDINAKFRIAHPYDFMKSGKWAEYMHYLYTNKIVQPFKQVFREFYPVTEDEKQEKNVSRRYAGNQVWPQKTVGLLRGQGWTVDFEDGLQKVFYKENLIAKIYAMADWFSPSDIEAPTLEVVRFYDRKTLECVDFTDIPPIVFSETMRDLDLVVSVAHVGGVDPEASHSTTEMRIAIARELLKLLKVTNVNFIGMHAKIQGSLANYSVHMGSGVVHAEAIGMIAILPVHSQARGRIFLPFADEDPKTAEIMSKIILLSEDKKIKDPSILSQLK